jgi:hypothetical protein
MMSTRSEKLTPRSRNINRNPRPAQGEWTCTDVDFTGTMHGPMKGSDGKLIAPTNKKFHIEFCTVAHWKNGEIIEEKLFYGLVGS